MEGKEKGKIWWKHELVIKIILKKEQERKFIKKKHPHTYTQTHNCSFIKSKGKKLF